MIHGAKGSFSRACRKEAAEPAGSPRVPPNCLYLTSPFPPIHRAKVRFYVRPGSEMPPASPANNPPLPPETGAGDPPARHIFRFIGSDGLQGKKNRSGGPTEIGRATRRGKEQTPAGD